VRDVVGGEGWDLGDSSGDFDGDGGDEMDVNGDLRLETDDSVSIILSWMLEP
jgi:hypothetical protein